MASQIVRVKFRVEALKVLLECMSCHPILLPLKFLLLILKQSNKQRVNLVHIYIFFNHVLIQVN